MMVEQAMLRVGTDLYFEVISQGEIIEEGKYEEVCETMDYEVDRIEIVDVDTPTDMICRIHL